METNRGEFEVAFFSLGSKQIQTSNPFIFPSTYSLNHMSCQPKSQRIWDNFIVFLFYRMCNTKGSFTLGGRLTKLCVKACKYQ
jgi:hypothetical protein